MSHKRVFDEFVADDSAMMSPNSKRSKITETANKNDSNATPNDHQLRAPGMNIQPLDHISELNYRNAAASSHPVKMIVAGAQMPPPMASSNKFRNTAAVVPPVQASSGQKRTRRQPKKTSRPAAPAMQNPAPPQPHGIFLARDDSPLGLFYQERFWDTPIERQAHLDRMRDHDEMIRHFIWLLAPHDVKTSSASPEAQSRACAVHYDCITRFLSIPYSDKGLRVQAYPWDVKPSDEMLLQQLEADTYIAVNSFGRGQVSVTEAKGIALCRQEHSFLAATSLVFTSIMKLLIRRSRRDLLVDHIDAQAWSRARKRAQLGLEYTEKEHWPSNHTDNFFVRLMAISIHDMTVSSKPANCSAMATLQWCLYNTLLISESLRQDAQAINAVEGIEIGGPMYMSIEKMLEPIKADLRRQVGRDRADQAAQAAQALLTARAQRQAKIQAQYWAAQQQQQQQGFTGRAPFQQGAANVSQASRGRVQPFAPTPARPVAQFSQHRARSERIPRPPSSTPAPVSQPVLQESTAPRKRKRSGHEAVDADAGSVLKKSRHEWNRLPSSNFADIEVARPTKVASAETANSTQTTFEGSWVQSRSAKPEPHRTTADPGPPMEPQVATFTELLSSTEINDQVMEQFFDFSAASSDNLSDTGGSNDGFVPSNDIPLDGSNVGPLPGHPVSTDQPAEQNSNASQLIAPGHDIPTSHDGNKLGSPKGPALPPAGDEEFRAFLQTLKNDSFLPWERQKASLMPHLPPASPRASRSNSNTSHLSNEEFLSVLDDMLRQTRDSINVDSR